MSRTVTALYDSRSEAETARGRLVSEIKTQSTRIIAKDTAAAVDGLQIDPKDSKTYRQAIGEGSHLLVAEIAPGQDPKRVITVLEQSIGSGINGREGPLADAPMTFGMTTEPEERAVAAEQVRVEPEVEARQDFRVEEPMVEQRAAPAVEEARIPRLEEELRIDTRQVSRGGARVRSITRETPAEQQVALSEERVDIENRPSERRLSIEDVRAGGLLRDRIFEIREMREEPVITKEAFVREEVIVRKMVQERTQTVRDSVRRTDVEVEELPARDEPRRGFFGGRQDRK
jgi:stress response protein YsnF